MSKAYLNGLLDISANPPKMQGVQICSEDGPSMTIYNGYTRWLTLAEAEGSNYSEARANMVRYIKMDPLMEWTHKFLAEEFF